MKDYPAPSWGLSTLPFEILKPILDTLPYRELKNVRVCSKLLSEYCNPRLFEQYTLYPHRKSFANLTSIARTPLRRLVKRLDYDVRFLYHTESVVLTIQHVINNSAKEGADAELDELLIKARALHEGRLGFSTVMDKLEQLRLLNCCLPHLDNLKHLIVWDGPYRGHRSGVDVPFFYYEELLQQAAQLCRDRRGPRQIWWSVTGNDDGVCVLPVLMAAAKLPQSLQKLEAAGGVWEPFLYEGDFSRHEDILSQVLGQFKALTFSTHGSRFSRRHNDKASQEALLKTAVNLEQLSICFRSNTSTSLMISALAGDLRKRGGMIRP